MKSIAKVILVGGFIIASQVAQGQVATFPSDDMDGGSNVPVQRTYMDRHANDPVRSAGSVFPSDDMDGGPNVPAQRTYLDRHANDPVKSSGSTFPSAAND